MQGEYRGGRRADRGEGGTHRGTDDQRYHVGVIGGKPTNQDHTESHHLLIRDWSIVMERGGTWQGRFYPYK